MYAGFLPFRHTTDQILTRTAERTIDKDPAQYLLTLEQMIENDYPIPSYIADMFEKPPGWVETPEAPKESLLAEKDKDSKQGKQKIYAIDCEMVGLFSKEFLLFEANEM